MYSCAVWNTVSSKMSSKWSLSTVGSNVLVLQTINDSSERGKMIFTPNFFSFVLPPVATMNDFLLNNNKWYRVHKKRHKYPPKIDLCSWRKKRPTQRRQLTIEIDDSDAAFDDKGYFLTGSLQVYNTKSSTPLSQCGQTVTATDCHY